MSGKNILDGFRHRTSGPAPDIPPKEEEAPADQDAGDSWESTGRSGWPSCSSPDYSYPRRERLFAGGLSG
jgi:hypothetical protein